MNPLEIKKRKTIIYIHRKRVDLINSILSNKFSLSRTLSKTYSKFLFLLETSFERNQQFIFTNDIFYYEGFSKKSVLRCMKFLKDNNIITVHTPIIKNQKYSTIRRDKSTFISLNLDFPEETYSGRQYVIFEYDASPFESNSVFSKISFQLGIFSSPFIFS